MVNMKSQNIRLGKYYKDERGFTLIEVVITVFVSVVALIAVLGTNTYLQRANVQSHERIRAMQDANQVIEQMREAATYGFFPSNVTSNFQNGQAVTGFSSLNQEQVMVQYASSTADPLDVTVTVNWVDTNSRNASYSLNTLMTQRE